MGINHSNLSAFHAVAQAGSFTLAARHRNVSQPTLSAQVKALETAYGVRLFDRIGRTVRLTPVGQNLSTITARLFATQDEAEALLAGTQTLSHGHLRIAADSASHVMPAMGLLRKRYPGLTISLRGGNSSEVLQQLFDYEADVAITAKQTSDPRVQSTLLRTDHLVGFVLKSHPLAKRASVPIKALEGQSIVLRERGSVTREVFETRLAEAGVKPDHLLEVQTREAVRDAVRAGFGIGVTFDGEFREDNGLKRLRLIGADFAVAEFAVCLTERLRLPMVRTFLDAVLPKVI